jgi:hypothetical protein
MNESLDIKEKLKLKLDDYEAKEYSLTPPKIIELLELFKNLDHDLSPIIDILIYSVKHSNNTTYNALLLSKFLNFYGLGENTDILLTRQKFKIVGGELVKTPFLKKKDKEAINTLLSNIK